MVGQQEVAGIGAIAQRELIVDTTVLGDGRGWPALHLLLRTEVFDVVLDVAESGVLEPPLAEAALESLELHVDPLDL